MFHGLVSGAVSVDSVAFDVVMADIEALNSRASTDDPLEVTKLSASAFGRLRDRYVALEAGAALGRGCGPLVVRRRARPEFSTLESLAGRRVAVPGLQTTAMDLLRRFGPPLEAVPMSFDAIMPAVQQGEFDAGLIIHEGRFTYAEHDLEPVADLGEVWEDSTGAPLPLGVIAVLREHAELGPRLEAGIASSVRAGRANPRSPAEYVAAHAQELDEAVCAQHIELYVNAFSEALGPEGRAAVEALIGPDPDPWLARAA